MQAAGAAPSSRLGRDVGAEREEVVEERVPTAAEQAGKSDMQDIKRAAAWRVKYRVRREDGSEAPRQNIAPHLVAWHKNNRRGMKANADRCQQLLSWYVGAWDADEADHQCVAVENKPGCDEMQRHNQLFRENDRRFAPAPQRPEVAAATHSHLNLTMHNCRAGAEVSWPRLLKYCVAGRLSMDRISAADKEMASHIQRGLFWEVLSWRMEEEEPIAFEVIQEALNSKHSAALVVHEMEHLSGLADTIVDVGTGLADRFNFCAIRDRLLLVGSTVIAEAPEFASLVQVVATALGGNAAGRGGYNHWAEMKEFHETMINPKTRRVRLQTFAQLCHVPEQFPRTRNAIYRAMYSGPPATPDQIRNGLVFMKTVGSLIHLEEPKWLSVLKATEDVLERWHIEYADLGAFKHMPPKLAHTLWAQVEPKIVGPLLRGHTDPTDARAAMEEAARQEDEFVRRKIPPTPRALLPPSLGGSVMSEACAAGGEAPAPRRPPDVSVDARGRVTKQEQEIKTAGDVDVDWEASLRTGHVNAARASLHAALWRAAYMHKRMPVKVEGSPPKKAGCKKKFQSTKVRVTKDVAKGEIVLVPVVKGPESIVTKTTHLQNVISVMSDDPLENPVQLHILPSVQYGSATEKSGSDGCFMPPCWCCRHATADETSNMELCTVTYEAIESALQEEYDAHLARGWRNTAASREVPGYTNTSALKKGTELLLPRTKCADGKDGKKQEGAASTLWKDECRRQLRAGPTQPSGELKRQASG